MSDPIREPVGRYRQDHFQILDPDRVDAVVAAHPKAAALLSAWRTWRGGGRALPDRGAIDPLDIPWLLANLVLLDVEQDDFRVRLVGELVASRYAHRLKGKCIGELMTGSSRDETLYEHRRCVEERRPVLTTHTDAQTSLGDINAYVRLILPLGEPDSEPSHIIGVMDFYR
ncbi:MAG: PAS domain-containing protein [Thalassobaculaceae bacterium]|nr:PAS domain-containing protein [Thalassobaculaceae bacterium]